MLILSAKENFYFIEIDSPALNISLIPCMKIPIVMVHGGIIFRPPDKQKVPDFNVYS